MASWSILRACSLINTSFSRSYPRRSDTNQRARPNAANFDPPLELLGSVGDLFGLVLGFAHRPVGAGVQNLLRSEGGLVCPLFLLVHAQHALDHYLSGFTFPLLEGS